MKINYGDYKIAFIDQLFNMLAMIMLFFILSFLLISTNKNNKEGIIPKSEFLIADNWDAKIDCDVDFWVRTPHGMIVSYQSKDADLVNLERDDIGTTGDISQGPNGTTIYSGNYEYVSLRKLIEEGTYQVSIHLYKCFTLGTTAGGPGSPVDPLSVTVEFTMLNPTFKSVFKKTFVFDKVWEEIPVAEFKFENGQFILVGNDFPPIVTRKN